MPIVITESSTSPVMSLKQVIIYTTLSKTQIYKLIRLKDFPPSRPMKNIERVVWLRTEVDEWLDVATSRKVA